MSRSATIRDVARAAGVSTAAVSRVLNPGSGAVSSSTRERVLAAVEDLSYRPRTAARELRGGARPTLALVLADVTNPFFAQLADRVVWEARSHDVTVQLMTTREDPTLEAESLTALLQRRIGSVIATPTGGNVERWEDLREAGTSVVFVDRRIEGFTAATVSTADEESGHAAAQHLLRLGHQRIGVIAGPSTTSTGRDRVTGHARALTEHGLTPDPSLVHQVPFRGDQGADAVSALLDTEDPPTALVVANTAQVVSSMRRLALRGVRTGQDLSVVVFDDNPWTELHTPALTVVRQPIGLVARHAVTLALRQDARDQVRVRADLVPRASTGLAPAAS